MLGRTRTDAHKKAIMNVPALATITIGLILSSAVGLENALFGQTIAGAFAIPSSGLVFDGSLTLGSGSKVTFSVREGAFLLLDPSPSDTEDQLGVSLLLDRTQRTGTERRIIVHSYRIEPHPSGGDVVSILARDHGAYGQSIQIHREKFDVVLRVTAGRLAEFKDDRTIAELWSRIREDASALSGLYEELHSIYGPAAQECRTCAGVLVCATAASCVGE